MNNHNPWVDNQNDYFMRFLAMSHNDQVAAGGCNGQVFFQCFLNPLASKHKSQSQFHSPQSLILQLPCLSHGLGYCLVPSSHDMFPSSHIVFPCSHAHSLGDVFFLGSHATSSGSQFASLFLGSSYTHPKLRNINTIISLILLYPESLGNACSQFKSHSFLLHISTLVSRFFSLMQTTKEVNPHPRIASCVNMWSVTFLFLFFFIFLCQVLNVGTCICHIVWEGQVEWSEWTTPTEVRGE